MVSLQSLLLSGNPRVFTDLCNIYYYVIDEKQYTYSPEDNMKSHWNIVGEGIVVDHLYHKEKCDHLPIYTEKNKEIQIKMGVFYRHMSSAEVV